jgi:DNA-binding response OmpR family regulator
MPTKSVLIADDDRALAHALALRLKEFELHVRVAYDALTAINMVHQLPPDLAILDVNMPAGSGLSVCEMMATDSTTSRIPVIILTGRKDAETIRRCHDMLAYYVPKCPDLWKRVEPVIYELIAPGPPSGNGNEMHRAT